MSDDHAMRAVSAYDGTLIATPNIDRIAHEGVLFVNSFVTNSICAPSRAVHLTGKYSHINGLMHNGNTFDSAQTTYPKLLRAAGYQTAVIGKWHLRTPPAGFDYSNILVGQGQYYNPVMVRMGDTVRHTGYTTDVITDDVLQFLENRDPSRSFCLLYHHKAPHRNWMPDTRHLSLLRDTQIPHPATLFDDYITRTRAAREQDMEIADMYLSMDMKLLPEYYGEETGSGGSRTFDAESNWLAIRKRMTADQLAAWDSHYTTVNEAFRDAGLTGDSLTMWMYQQYLKDYLRCVVSIDENIGRVLDYLDQNGLAENTLVVYTSDQGFYLGEHGWYDKRFMYEPSLKTPLVIRYPAEISPGQVRDEIVLNLDMAPTLLDFAGVMVPDALQGKSLLKLCTSDKTPDWRKSMYYHYYQSGAWHYVPKHYGVRTHDYKLIHFYELDEWELYDLKSDPDEVRNLIGDTTYTDVTQRLKSQIVVLQEQYRVPPD